MSGALQLVMEESGPIPTPLATIRSDIANKVAQTNPGYTHNLPGTLIEDVLSTVVQAVSTVDQLRVDTINSFTPYGANAFLLNEFGQIYGVTQGAPTNTSVFARFTSDTPGFPIPPGFVVSDGTQNYIIRDGGIIASGGHAVLLAVAVNSGSWAVPINSVTTILTSVPGGISLSVNNPNVGTPGSDAETEESYRTAVLAAGLVAAVGTPAFLKIVVGRVSGVQRRLIGIRQVVAGWQVMVGGAGDPYEVGYAILTGIGGGLPLLTGSSIDSGRNVTVSINDYPDVYSVVFINPPSQEVLIEITWNTTGTGINFVSGVAVADLGIPAVVAYINSIPVGAPLNLLDLQRAFEDAVEPVLPRVLLTRFIVRVEIDTVFTPPLTGTYLVQGDPEGFFHTNSGSVSVAQG